MLKTGVAASAASMLPATSSPALPLPPFEGNQLEQAPLDGITLPRERILFDANWKFAFGHANDPDKDFGYGKLSRERTFAKPGHLGMSQAKYDDKEWRNINLPHDWAVELPFVVPGSIPNLNTDALPEQGGYPLGRNFPETSIGWYRKVFSLAKADKGKRFELVFDGIYRDAVVLVNGHYIAGNFSGYAPFHFDITDYLDLDASNGIAVRVDATLGDGWFYEGAGIYRHVWLIKKAPVHLVEWGAYVRPEVKGFSAQVELGSEVMNTTAEAKELRVQWQLLDSAGKVAATATSASFNLPPRSMHLVTGKAVIASPALWSVETPTLYRSVAILRDGSDVIDKDFTPFGIRTIRWDVQKGLYLNEKPVRIKGTCCHQDHAGVGVALPDRINYYRVERLKSMGSNALRTSHNPPTPELLDAADTLGMLVMCETRMMDSGPEGLSQLERMMRRFRNHPSIFLWSLGNEEPEYATERGQRIVATMQHLAHDLDPTRLCTVAANRSQDTGVSNIIDVVGINYSYGATDMVRKKFPDKPIIGSETASTTLTRGIYVDDKEAGFVNSYDTSNHKASAWWTAYDTRPFASGGFMWTGFDYRGEPTPYRWPCISSHFGALDTCGFPKDVYFYYRAWWQDEPVLHLFPHWNWPEKPAGQPISVWAYSNLEDVELFVNGQSQGTQKIEHDGHAEWKVLFAPGAIEVRGSKGGKVVLTAKRETTGPAARIVLKPDRSTLHADGEDCSMVTVEIQDAQGRLMPIADNEVAFEVSGGALIGVGNGNPSSHESDKGAKRAAYNGLAMAIVQATITPGSITIRATSPGLEPATATLSTNPGNVRLGA
jgi:beta-galactosidase